MHIEKLVVPTPFPVGPINLYLILDDPLTLIDTGPKTDEAYATLNSELARVGSSIESLRRIILTHTHEDHCGLAAQLARESGASVHVHEWEMDNIIAPDVTRVSGPLLERAGVPAGEIEDMSARYARIHNYAEAVESAVSFKDDDEFVFASGSLRVVHTPGHTPGSSCLFRESNRLLLSGDTVLKNITPNPILNRDPIDPARRFPSLGEYLVSLARIRSLAPTLVRTSHGADVTDFEEHFHRFLRHTSERQASVIKMVPKEGASAWEVSRGLFPGVKDIHRFLAVSETIAHLDQATAENKLVMEERGGVDRWVRS